MIGILRLLHGEDREIIGAGIDILWRLGVEPSGEFIRPEVAMLVVTLQADLDVRTVFVDQLGCWRPADERHVVAGHQNTLVDVVRGVDRS